MNEFEKSFFSSVEQGNLYGYENYFKLFVNLYQNKLLPNKILLTGQSGLGKATFAYHFINYVLSENEESPYNLSSYSLNPENKSFKMVSNNCHANFYLIKDHIDKQTIDIEQVRSMINFANKTSYKKNIKFILIDNSEFLNLYSLNALLKIVEEPNLGIFFIFIHNSSSKIADTLKSRCVEFKIFFNKKEKDKILSNLLLDFNFDLKKNIFNHLVSFYDSPGYVLKLIKFINDNEIDFDETNQEDFISKIMQIILRKKSNYNLSLLQSCLELICFNKIGLNKNKNRVLLNYSKIVKQLNQSKIYNIDMNNTFYEIKENLIHG